MAHHPSAIATARRLAAERPRAMLPCPVCVASLRAENLAAHLRKVHGEASAGETSSTVTLGGAARILGRELIAAFAVVLGLAAGGIAWRHGALDDATVAIGVAVVSSFLVLALLAALDLFRARLELEGDEVRLRYAWGLRQRTVTLRDVEVGRLWTMRSQPALRQEVKVDAGVYLRLTDGRRRITVGCPRGSAFRKHWSPSGWRNGKQTRYWDITLERDGMVALEYALAERSLLSLRES